MGALLQRRAGHADPRRDVGRAHAVAPGPRCMSVDMSIDLGRGLRLANPVGLASGTAGFGFELAELIDLDRVGALYTKGTTRDARAGNAPPRLAETVGGMLNSIGLQNPGVEHVAREYAPRFAQWRCAVIANVAGATVDEYVDCVRILDRAPQEAACVTAAVREVTQRCVIVKLSPNVTDIGTIAASVESAGADAVSAVNTYVGMKIHRHLRAPVLPRAGTGGLSGPAIKPLALAAVSAVRQVVRIPVIGIGGISDTGDAVDFLVAGADAIQVGTATFTDPSAAVRIVDGVRAYLAEAGLSRPCELRWRPPDVEGTAC